MFRQVHFRIPRFAIDDVSRAVSTLRTEVAKLLSEDGEDAAVFYFDSSEYFNLSYRLATAFPDLWESTLIRSYHSSRPPVHLLQSDHDSNASQNDAIFGSSLLVSLFRRTAVVFGAMMLYFGTINIRLQKMVITVSQPLILAGICLMYYEVAHAKWIVIFPCLGVTMLFFCQFHHHFKAGSTGDGKIGVDADDDASINAHSRQSRSFNRLSLRRTPQHDRHEEAESEHRQERGVFEEPEMEVAGAEAEVRRGEVVETPPGGVHEAHDDNSNSDVDGEDGLSEDQRAGDVKFSDRISWESDSTAEPIAVRGEGKEGQKEYWFDGQRVWDEDEDEEMPNHLFLHSDDEALFDGFAKRQPGSNAAAAGGGGGDVGQKVQEGVGLASAYPIAVTAAAEVAGVGRRWKDSEEDGVTGAAMLTDSSRGIGIGGRIISGCNRPEEQRRLRARNMMLDELLHSRLNRLKAGEPENPDGPDYNALVAMIIREREEAVNAKAAAIVAAAEIAINNAFRNMQIANAAEEAVAVAVAAEIDVLDDDEIAFNIAFRDMLNASP
jgi:hypothetical protein